MYACVVNLKNNRLVRCFESLKHKSVVVTVSDSIIIWQWLCTQFRELKKCGHPVTMNDLDSINECSTSESLSKKVNVFQPVYYILLFLIFWKAAFRISTSSTAAILRYIKYIVRLLGNAYNCKKIIDTSDSIAITLCSVENTVGLTKQMFIRYVVCPSCSVIYEYTDCVRA